MKKTSIQDMKKIVPIIVMETTIVKLFRISHPKAPHPIFFKTTSKTKAIKEWKEPITDPENFPEDQLVVEEFKGIPASFLAILPEEFMITEETAW